MTSKKLCALMYAIVLFSCGHAIGNSDGSGPDFWYPVVTAGLVFTALLLNLMNEDD